MNKLFTAGLLLLTGLSACTGYGRKVDTTPTECDTIGYVSETEEESWDDLFIEDTSPSGVDILFEDFMYLFSTDYDFQRQRVRFPIVSSSYKAKSHDVEADEWEHDSLLMGLNYYTLLFDSEAEADAPNDSLQMQAHVEWYDIQLREVKVYSFEKAKKGWFLEEIGLHPLSEFAEQDFVDFYQKFVNDSVYQAQHVKSPLNFVTIDPDDDFAVLTTTLDMNQWFAFRPVLPDKILSNIRLGQRKKTSSNVKVMSIKGNGNGISYTLCFRKRGKGDWMLYKYEDISI